MVREKTRSGSADIAGIDRISIARVNGKTFARRARSWNERAAGMRYMPIIDWYVLRYRPKPSINVIRGTDTVFRPESFASNPSRCFLPYVWSSSLPLIGWLLQSGVIEDSI